MCRFVLQEIFGRLGDQICDLVQDQVFRVEARDIRVKAGKFQSILSAPANIRRLLLWWAALELATISTDVSLEHSPAEGLTSYNLTEGESNLCTPN